VRSQTIAWRRSNSVANVSGRRYRGQPKRKLMPALISCAFKVVFEA
jgi:hypothetical protein